MNENSSNEGKAPRGMSDEPRTSYAVVVERTRPDGTLDREIKIFRPENLAVEFLETLTDEMVRVLVEDLRKRKLSVQADLLTNLVFLQAAACQKRTKRLAYRDRLSVMESLGKAVGDMKKLGWEM